MKTKRIFRDLIELILLLIGGWYGLKYLGRDIASHDGIVVVFLFFAYGSIFILNLIAQIVISAKTTKKETALLVLRIKTFGIILLIPTLVMALFFIGDGIQVLLFAIAISGAVSVYYILVNVCLFYAGKYFEHYKSLSQ